MMMKLRKSEFRTCGEGWGSFRKKSVMNLEMCVESIAVIHMKENWPSTEKSSSCGSSIIGWFHCPFFPPG